MPACEVIKCVLGLSESERVGDRQPDKPLIRIRVDYNGGFEPFNTFRCRFPKVVFLCKLCSR